MLAQIPLFLGCLLLACLPLPQFAGEGGKGLALLCGLFILAAFGSKIYELFFQAKDKAQSLFTGSFKIDKIDLSICFLILAAFISTADSCFWKESLSGFIKYFLYFLIYISFVFCLKSRKDIYLLIGAVLIGCSWVALEGLSQVFVGAEELATWEDPNIAPSQHLNRIYSTLLNPNLLAGYLLALWPLILPFVFSHKKSSGLVKETKIANSTTISSPCQGGGGGFSLIFKGLKVLAVLLLVYLTFQTGSRGAWIALAGQFGLIGLGLLVFYRNWWLIGGFASALMAALFYILSKASILNRLTSIFSSYDHSSNSFRLHVWQACLRLIADNPIFGIGVGSKAFYLAYGVYMDSNYSALGAYSLFLELTSEMGLIGLAALLYLIFIIAQKGLYILKNVSKASEEFFMVFALLLSLTGLLVDGFFDIVILRPQIQIPLWLILAIFRFYSREISQKSAK